MAEKPFRPHVRTGWRGRLVARCDIQGGPIPGASSLWLGAVSLVRGERPIMSQVVTSDQFVTGLLCELRLNGVSELKLVDNLTDARFEQAYRYLIDRSDSLEVEPDFSLIANTYHGDSETLRETLYAVREQGVVAINNPSFKTVEIKLDNSGAEGYLKALPLPRTFFEDVVRLYFSPQDMPRADSSQPIERTPRAY